MQAKPPGPAVLPPNRSFTGGATQAVPHQFPVAEQRCQIVLLSGPSKGKVIPIKAGPGSETKIGKADENDVVLVDDTVSRFHCSIVREGDGWLLRDQKSTNGTFIDDARVKEAYLRPGVTIRAGAALFRFASELTPVSLPPSTKDRFGSLVGKSVKMREIFALLERVAKSDATVLITGETGTGKGAVARAIHEQSGRANGPFVVVDCGAVAPTLIESELFGHERGAFTGAEQRRAGALEQAKGGTLFLDELDDLRKDLQPKLLRALEDRTFQRVGSNQSIALDARVVAATKKDLRMLITTGAFREDLYFRLAVFQLELPPLRDRKDDLPGLVDRFAIALGYENAWVALPQEVKDRLHAHSWPGNVRELRNAIERAFALGEGGAPGLHAWRLETGVFHARDPLEPEYDLPFKGAKEKLVERFEQEYLRRLLQRAGGNVARAAREAELDRKHLYTLLHKYGLAGRGGGEA
jgi:DNA-binding NtrC family response regulator